MSRAADLAIADDRPLQPQCIQNRIGKRTLMRHCARRGMEI